MADENLLNALRRRRPGLEAMDPLWTKIEDILNQNVKSKGQAGWTSPYIPRGRLEPTPEYSLRVDLTPFFPKTPATISARLGALFEKGLEIQASGLEEFIKHAGARHATFEDIASQAAMFVQAYGFCAAMLDRAQLPADAAGRDVSKQEAAERALARPYLALYTAPSILDWEYAGDGRLAWVKFGEARTLRESWAGDTIEELVYRIVDRESVYVYHVRKDAAGNWQVTADTPAPHGFADRVPVVFVHPFPNTEGIGQPILRRQAEADIAATRVLSDLVWALFILGNPILTLTTNRSEDELGKMAMGASRYLPLRGGNKNTGEDAEELNFVQLDATGLELMFRAHALFAGEGQGDKEQGEETSIGIPQQSSGISQAWRFKTGEERVLFLLVRALEPFLTECLELAALAIGTAAAPTVTIPLNFSELETVAKEK